MTVSSMARYLQKLPLFTARGGVGLGGDGGDGDGEGGAQEIFVCCFVCFVAFPNADLQPPS